MKIAKVEKEGVVCLRIDGRLDGKTASEVESTVKGVLEASEICRTVLALARSQDVRLCDVAVLGRSPAALHGSLREGFESLGARPFDLAGRPLSQTRAGHTLVLLLQVIQDDYARRTLMELLSVADIDWPGVGVSQSAASFWDSLSMRAGIVQGRQQWLGRLRSLRSRLAGNRGGNDRHAPANQTEKLAALDALIDTVESLLSRLERIRQSKDWGQMVRHVAGTYEWLVHSSPASEAIMAINRGLAQLGPLGDQLADQDQSWSSFAKSTRTINARAEAFRLESEAHESRH